MVCMPPVLPFISLLTLLFCFVAGVSSIYTCCSLCFWRPSEQKNLDWLFDDRHLNMMHFKSGLELTELQNMTVPEDDNISNDSNDFTEVENGQINRWVFLHKCHPVNDDFGKLFWFSVSLVNYSFTKVMLRLKTQFEFLMWHLLDIVWNSGWGGDREVIYSSFQIFQLSLIKMYKYIGPQPAQTSQNSMPVNSTGYRISSHLLSKCVPPWPLLHILIKKPSKLHLRGISF